MLPTERIGVLTAEINKYNHSYWVLDHSLVSDEYFDTLLIELKQLEASYPLAIRPNSPTKRIGTVLTDGFTKVQHSVPMLSLENAFSDTDIYAFDTRVSKLTNKTDILYYPELKFDGLAIKLTYKNGLLTQACTRGTGIEGDDVTTNAYTIKTIPLSFEHMQTNESWLGTEIEVRGEVIFFKKDFERIKNEYGFANARNAASGTMKLHNSQEVARRKLTFIAYGIDLPGIACSERYRLLRELGFLTYPVRHEAVNCEQLMHAIDNIQSIRHTLPFEIDGVVIKTEDTKLWPIVGNTNTAPRHSIAYKFKAESATTVLKAIDWQVGRLGAITPVAILEPVYVAGSTISKATLHNVAEIARLGLSYGDTVYIEKAGDVIPKITGIVEDNCALDNRAIIVPEHCPICNTRIQFTQSGLSIYCPNDEYCRGQLMGRLEHWCSKKAMDLQGVSTALLEKMFDHGCVHNIGDLYSLTEQDLIGIEGFGETTITNILNAIDTSKSQPWNRVLYGLGIPSVGQRVANKIAENYSLAEVARGQFGTDVSALIRQAINTYFETSYGQHARWMIDSYKLNSYIKRLALTDGILKNQTFLFTGTLLTLKRSEAEELVRMHGGTIASSVSKNLTFLVTGDKAGSKLAKAKTVGVTILSEEKFLRMLS